MQKITDILRIYSPIILILLTTILLMNTPKILYIFIIGSVINITLNSVIKTIIKEPRPSKFKSENYIEKFEGAHKYGMPSGHAQSMLFSITFLYLINGSIIILLFSLFIASICIYERWKWFIHTYKQLLIGALIGTLFAFSVIEICKNNLDTDIYIYKMTEETKDNNIYYI